MSTEQFTDAEIVTRIQNGQSALFEILIRRNNRWLYKTGRSYNYNHDDTLDLMQDSWVDAFRNLSKFEGRSSFKTWIIRIMLNNCYRKQQKSGFKNEISGTIHENSTPMFTDSKSFDTNRSIINNELRQVIENALCRIPDDYRMVFSLREINGLSVEETADVLTISTSNVKVRLNRAKTMLRKEIEQSYTSEEIFEFNLVYCDAMVNRVMQQINKLSSEIPAR